MKTQTKRKYISLLLATVLFFSCIPWSVPSAAAAPAEKSPADDCKILDYVHEEVFEKGDHLGRMEEEETLSNYVFLNKDGTRTAYYLDEAVKFVDSDGTIKEKDITLKSVLGGYATTQNDVTVTLPINMSNGVNLSFNDHQISLVPEGGTAAAPRVVNNAAEYTDFYGTDTMLKYTPTLSGVKEDIILESYTGINTFTFILNTNGLAVYHTPEDRYYLAPGKGSDAVYWLGALEIYDAALNMGDGTMTVDTLKAGQQYRITITVDTAWLTSASTVYPVTVDPTITVSYANNGSGYIDDAPIYEGYPTKNYGSYIYNRAGYAGSSYKRGRTIVRLTALLSDASYETTTANDITSVYFYTADASGSTGDLIHLCAINKKVVWNESTVTWDTIQEDFSVNIISSAIVGSGNFASFELTSLVKIWKDGFFNSGQSGFLLVGANETTNDRVLYSSEHSTASKRPYVTATYYAPVAQETLGISNDTDYFIMNYASGKLMTMDVVTVNGNTNVCVTTRRRSTVMQWRTSLQANEEYQLISVYNPSNLVLSVTGTNVDVCSNSNTPNQKFVITRIASGDYVGLYYIRYGDYYIAQEPTTDNVIVTTQLSENCVWSFMAVDKGTSTIFSMQYSGFDTTANNTLYTTSLSAVGYVSESFVGVAPSVAYASLLNAGVFAFRGHGFPGSISFHDTEGTAIGKIKVIGTSLYNPEDRYVTSCSANELASLRCVLYIGCKTGVSTYLDQVEYNLVTDTYKKGAHFVLGTTETVYTSESNAFLKGFLDGVSEGKSLYECIQDGLSAEPGYPVTYIGDISQYFSW